MDTTQPFGLLRFGEICSIHREGDRANAVIQPASGGRVIVAWEGVREFVLIPSESGAAPIESAATLTALRLMILQPVIDGEALAIAVMATQRHAGPRTGRLRIRADSARVTDERGDPLSLEALVMRAQTALATRLGPGSARDYRKLLDTLLNREIRPLLVAVGFSVDKRVFVRPRAEIIDTLGFEIDRFSSAESFTFTMRATLLVGQLPPGTKATERAALTSAYPAYRRQFEPHTITHALAPALVAMQVVDDTSEALVWFDGFHTLNDVVAFLAERDRESGHPEHAYTRGMLLGRAGRVDEARAAFEHAIGDREAIRRAAALFGIAG